MTDLENVVYIPYWLLIVLLFLSSGALQYALIGAVRWVKQWSEDRARRRLDAAMIANGILRPNEVRKVLLLDDARKERAQ